MRLILKKVLVFFYEKRVVFIRGICLLYRHTPESSDSMCKDFLMVLNIFDIFLYHKSIFFDFQNSNFDR